MLTFPTQAEQAVEAFNSAIKTISLTTICEKMGADRSFKYPHISYTFDDDTSLTISGRGNSHKVETYLP